MKYLNRYLRSNHVVALLAALFFMVAGVVTIRDYGPSWDEAVHFSRGQAYLNFFLTGSKDYSDLSVTHRSFYQFDYHSGDYWFKDNGGHPPISDIIAASFNYILFQKLGLVGDIYSYHLFNIIASSFLVFAVVFFAYSTFGRFAAVVSFLTLVTYPLFWAESHFNIKDPPQVAFFSATVLAFYMSLKKGNTWWLFVSIIFFSLGLGTKFNILFLPFIVIPYLFLRYKGALGNIRHTFIRIPKPYFITFLLAPVIVVTVFIGTWPYLWDQFPENILNVVQFYKQIGTGFQYQSDKFYVAGFNTFPLLWILFTTPPVVLLLSIVGLFSAIVHRKEHGNITLLWLFWFLVPIVRVMIPGASIYGGIRQILEFLPALALISGLGAWQILELFKTKVTKVGYLLIAKVGLLLLFLWPLVVLVKLHPNQNVYFNSLIGGLRGAQDRNFPSWGNSYGNAYFQGVKWINAHAPTGAKVVLIQGIEVNTPDLLYRPDISLNNNHWSGIERQGEYVMELAFNDTGRAFHYTWEYVDKFLEPIYEVTVDRVAILKIWKNDLDHTKQEYRLQEKRHDGSMRLITVGNRVEIELDKPVVLSRIQLTFVPQEYCSPIVTSFMETSFDSKTWKREADWIPFPQVGKKSNLQGNQIAFYLAAREARLARFVFDDERSCGLNNPTITIYRLSGS